MCISHVVEFFLFQNFLEMLLTFSTSRFCTLKFGIQGTNDFLSQKTSIHITAKILFFCQKQSCVLIVFCGVPKVFLSYTSHILIFQSLQLKNQCIQVVVIRSKILQLNVKKKHYVFVILLGTRNGSLTPKCLSL